MGSRRSTAGERRRAGRDHGQVLAWLVLAISFLVSVLAAWYVQRNTMESEGRSFERLTRLTLDEIDKRMEAYLATIRSSAALFAASAEVTRDEFRTFVDALDLERNYPGIQGLGFGLALDTPAVEAPGAAALRETLSQVRIHGEPGVVATSAILYIEPQDERNRAALGYDMRSEPVRRQAMDRARDTGDVAASRRVTLVQEITEDKQPGFLIYVPLYVQGVPTETPEQRRAALLGWVYAPFRMGDLMEGIFGDSGQPMDVQVYASNEADPAQLLFDRGRRLESDRTDGLSAVRRLEVAGTTWTIAFSAPKAIVGSSGALEAPLVFLGSFSLGLLLFGLTWSQAKGRAQAEEARMRASFLADVSNLLARSLDAPELLESAARMTVPTLGDACTIDLVDDDGILERVAVVHRDPRAEKAMREIFQEQGLPEMLVPTVREVAQSGSSRLVAGLPPAWFTKASGVDPRLAELGRSVRSYLIVPVTSRSGPVGAVSFASSLPDRYGETDRTLAEDFGRRVGLALENVQLFARVQEAVRVRDDFLSVASHELRTPLTALQAQLQSLARAAVRSTGIPPERLPERLATAERQTRRLAKLIDELLDVSRITAGRLDLEPERFDLSDLVHELAARFREEAERQQSALEIDAPPGAVGVWDRHRLEQVATNLISNALKYGAGRPVEIAVKPSADEIRLCVRDRGIGVTPEARARIFDRFERAVSQRHYGGLGLGLYIARQIVEAHGGSIQVHSEGAGEGATFEVVLPREAGAPGSVPAHH